MDKKRKKIRITALTLVAAGVVLVAVSAIFEAQNYPWQRLLGIASQNADTIPDPSPIKLDPEDAGADVTTEFDEPAAAASASEAATVLQPASEPSPSGPARPTVSSPAKLPGDENDTVNAPAALKYVVIGMLKIPALNVSQNVLEGAGKQMKYGVGHIPSTAAIGLKGNCAIAGHRPYPFRYLDELKAGDTIVLKVGETQYTYTVYDSFAVLPDEVWVLDSVEGEDYTLTLITCTPYMVSSHRLIVRARLTDINGVTPQAFYGEEAQSPQPAPPEAPPPSESPTPPVTEASPSESGISATAPSETPAADTGTPAGGGEGLEVTAG